MSHSNLAAIRLTRRSVAVAIFIDLRLDYIQERHLSSLPQQAEGSAVGFLRWVVATFGIDSAALEQAAENDQVRRGMLTRLAIRTLRNEAVPVWEVNKEQLFEAFGIPALTTRKELRAISASFWPTLSGQWVSGAVWDAAALGIHVQTERLFLN